MQAVTTIGLDIAKSVFQAHGVDAAPRAKCPYAQCATHLTKLDIFRAAP